MIAVLALSPAVASAKVPPFTLDAAPTDPSAGEVVRLTVRFWDDAEHTDPARWPDMRRLDAFLWAHPAGSIDEATPIDLRRLRPGVYLAELTMSSPGTWILCTWRARCAGGSSMAGYPNRIELEVASSAPKPAAGTFAAPSAEPSPSVPTPVPLLALLALVATSAALMGRFGPRRT